MTDFGGLLHRPSRPTMPSSSHRNDRSAPPPSITTPGAGWARRPLAQPCTEGLACDCCPPALTITDEDLEAMQLALERSGGGEDAAKPPA